MSHGYLDAEYADPQPRESRFRRFKALLKHKPNKPVGTLPATPPSEHDWADNSRGRPKTRQYEYTGSAAAYLPVPILTLILSFACPHALDYSFTSSEDSMLDDRCGLCDLLTLSRASLVCSRWNEAAIALLYTSVRIDAVHFCERELELSQKRRRRTVFHHHYGEQKDAPSQRLQLFSKTVRENEHLASLVQILKLPYMTRESYKTDLARTISALPNLQYVDLPSGIYSGEASCSALRTELMNRCPNLKKMKYLPGSEQYLLSLPATRPWQVLEMLELISVNVDGHNLVQVLTTLPALKEVHLTSLPKLDDNAFTQTGYPRFPPLNRLFLEDLPKVTALGLTPYLNRRDVRARITHLSLTWTGVNTASLASLLAMASGLVYLSYTTAVSNAFPETSPPVAPLSSTSLQTLRYEITPTPAHMSDPLPPTISHYAYLANSLWSQTLSALQTLYVRNPSFPSVLASTTPYPHRLTIFTAPVEALTWSVTTLSPNKAFVPPVPIPSVALAPVWTASVDARRSMVVADGEGGFLAIPMAAGDEESGKRLSRLSLSGPGSTQHTSKRMSAVSAGAGSRSPGMYSGSWDTATRDSSGSVQSWGSDKFLRR